jgi:intein/homing endonuclease
VSGSKEENTSKMDEESCSNNALPTCNKTYLNDQEYENPDDYSQYDDTVPSVDPYESARVMKLINPDGTYTEKLRARKSVFIEKLVYLDGQPFSFKGRNYLRQIYDQNENKILLKTARQVEKCETKYVEFFMANGTIKTTLELNPGDEIISLDESTQKIVKDEVVSVGENGVKPVLKITTKKKRSVTVTHNHPFYKILGWTEAGNLKAGDFVALPHKAGLFGELSNPDEAFCLGALLGDGTLYENAAILTQLPGELLDEYLARSSNLDSNSLTEIKGYDKRTGSARVATSVTTNLFKYLSESGVLGSRSHNKKIPYNCFNYDKESARQLLRGLWGTDGHCKNVSSSKIDLCYSSTSETLIKDIERLLLKFGIFSVTRDNKPTKYKGTEKKAFILRVIGRRSFERFFHEIGPVPGKPFDLPTKIENNNCNKIPKDVDVLIKKAVKKYKIDLASKGISYQGNSPLSHGCRIDRSYDGYSYPKFKKWCEVLNDEALFKIYESDIFWDEIVSIEELPPEMTYGVEVKNNHNHITNGIITHNTTMLGNNMVIKSVVQPYHKSLYVSPSHAQTRQFSNEKLKPVLERSPFITKYFQSSKVSTQVFEKGFTNGSFIFMRSCFRSADRARGISANDLYLDEIQDLLISEIPVIAECTSHFDDYFHLFAGTPKTFDNPIEFFWQDSTQNEWMVKCKACGHWNFLDETNIAPTEFYTLRQLPPGPVCKKCVKHIDVDSGKWMCFNPRGSRQGYRIPQLMVPWIVGTYDQWDKLLWKRDNYPMGQFYNEVLGLSYDSSTKPITRSEIIACCDASKSFIKFPFTPETVSRCRNMVLSAGVDWGEGTDGSGKTPSGKLKVASYTVLTIGYYPVPNRFEVIFAKKYIGKESDPDYIIKDIAYIINTLNVRLVGCDWGHGWGMNNQLRRVLGQDRVAVYQHLGKLKETIKWDRLGLKFMLRRNFWISELMTALKAQSITFPSWKEFEPFARDILSVYTEYSEYTREMKYDHRPSDPDDFMHSLIYCKLAGDSLVGRKQW